MLKKVKFKLSVSYCRTRRLTSETLNVKTISRKKVKINNQEQNNFNIVVTRTNRKT